MKRPKSAAAAAKKKSVGFSSHNQTIDAPENAYAAPNFGVIAKKLEFQVSRAKDFETFKQIPRYSHSPLAVIHPAAVREIRPIWQPPKKLNFDGEKVVP